MVDSLAHQAKYDSALQIVQRHTRDSMEVKTLIWLANYSFKKDSRLSFRYFREALQLSEHIQYRKKIPLLYNNLGQLHQELGNYDSSLIFHRQAITLGLTINDSHQVSDAYQGISSIMLWRAKFDSAKLYLAKAQAISEKNNDFAGLATIYNYRGNIFVQEGNNAEALKQYILSAQLQDSLVHDPIKQATALANIGNIQYKMGNMDKAIRYTQEAQLLALKNDFGKVLAYTSQQLGRIYRKQKKFNEALVEYKKALAAYLRMGMQKHAAETYLGIGNIYFDVSDLKEAQNQYTFALRICKKTYNDQLMGIVYSAMGSSCRELKQYDRALSFGDSARIIGKRINDQYTVMDAYEILAEISEDQHQYKAALDYYQQFSDLKDSLNEAGNKSEMQELEMKYQNEKKITEIELLKSAQTLQTFALSRQRLIITSIIIALILVIAIGLLLVNRYRIMNRAKRLIEIERVRNTIARDLHDDIGSTLSSINILSQVGLVEKGENAQSYLQRIGDQSARIMEDMSDIVWSINPHNDSMSQVIIRMREFATEIFESKNIDYHFSEKVEASLTLDADKRKNLFLIFKETINNAAKYSNASKIEINLHQYDHTLAMHIKDNGQGFDELTITTGNGLRNLRERAKEINGKVTLKSGIGNGTEIELRLPIA